MSCNTHSSSSKPTGKIRDQFNNTIFLSPTSQSSRITVPPHHTSGGRSPTTNNKPKVPPVSGSSSLQRQTAYSTQKCSSTYQGDTSSKNPRVYSGCKLSEDEHKRLFHKFNNGRSLVGGRWRRTEHGYFCVSGQYFVPFWLLEEGESGYFRLGENVDKLDPVYFGPEYWSHGVAAMGGSPSGKKCWGRWHRGVFSEVDY